MKKTLWLLTALLLGWLSYAYAQRPLIRSDTTTVTTSVQSFAVTDISGNNQLLGWYIENTDSQDTVYVNMDGAAPTSTNSYWLLPKTSLGLGYDVTSIRLKAKSGSALVFLMRPYKQLP